MQQCCACVYIYAETIRFVYAPICRNFVQETVYEVPLRFPVAQRTYIHTRRLLFRYCCAFPRPYQTLLSTIHSPATLHRTAQECKRFVREHCREGSNPDYPWMQQIFTTLVTWRQLEQYLFPRLRTIWKSTPFRKAAPLDPDRNVFLHKVREGPSSPYCCCVCLVHAAL